MKTKAIILPNLVLIISLFCAVSTVSAKTNFCKKTSQTALQSCQTAARSDYSLAVGTCDNISDPAARKACQQQASANRKDALKTCKDQYGARQAVCQQLGGAPYDPAIDPANFVATIDNPYFPLTPDTTFIYEGQTAQGLEHNEVFVTTNTKVILGITCVEVRDRVWINGVLTEDTLDWYAQDKNGNVWYMGENSTDLAGGFVVSVEGSWTAGVDGAKPGIIMEAHPAIGDFYRQEFLLGTAEDMAEVLSLTESVPAAYCSLGNCLKTKETSPLEPDALENKYYAPGVGNVRTVDLVTGEILDLISIIPPGP
ncbi:MAG TPA: hypothetical protein VK551_07200 [Thermodesulfobacteriota bacterium]|nr:hypothetical protein [Thermodesulfobacteriota bacterium]